MNIIQASKALGITVRTVREWISTGILPATKVGKSWQISENII
jgi:excisionase family DNA binding protein